MPQGTRDLLALIAEARRVDADPEDAANWADRLDQLRVMKIEPKLRQLGLDDRWGGRRVELPADVAAYCHVLLELEGEVRRGATRVAELFPSAPLAYQERR